MTTEVEKVRKALAELLQLPLSVIKKKWELDFFSYVIDLAPTTAGATTTGSFLVQSDSAFAITRTTYVASTTTNVGAAGLQPYGSGVDAAIVPFVIRMIDSGAGRQLSSAEVHIDNWFGTAMRPFLWPQPKFLDPNSQFTLEARDLGSTARNLRFAFHGFKIFGDWGEFIARNK